jgi:hypothetical protein
MTLRSGPKQGNGLTREAHLPKTPPPSTSPPPHKGLPGVAPGLPLPIEEQLQPGVQLRVYCEGAADPDQDWDDALIQSLLDRGEQ